MTHPLLLALAAAALLPLAACNNQPRTNAPATDNAAVENTAAAAPVELPPTIRLDNKSFRCKDNSLAFVTFFQGDTQANVRETQDGTPTVLKAEKAGDPLTAEGGWKLTGDEKTGITLTRPGKAAITCRA
jgi:hypothetical protein